MPTESKHAAGLNAPLFKALAHPLRGRIMVLLTETQASPSELSRRLDEDLRTVARHVREMAKLGLLEQVGTATNRGGTAHIYKAIARPVIELESWEQLPQLLREVNSAWVAQLLIGDLVEAVHGRTFDARPGRTMLRIPAVVDQQGFEEIEPAAKAFLQAILDVQAASAERMAQSGDEGIRISIGALAFEVP